MVSVDHQQGAEHVNRLGSETSPYLLQHAHNPVDWYPWGPDAMAKAASEDKPIFLSVGYSSCHWCHVMAHESFEDAAIARYLNDHFVSIKVDREERPDVDSVYMSAVQVLRGQGGWPLSVFLTPDGLPFFGGTYFPPTDRQGMPSFQRVLESVVDAWQQQRDQLIASGKELAEQLGNQATSGGSAHTFDETLLRLAAEGMTAGFDATYGGFGKAPKFPQPMNLDFLLRQAIRTNDQPLLAKVRKTLDGMARGGMYDQIGGGFHRYSTDARWLVPHFEKMLYDNAQLARLYLDAWLATKDDVYRTVAVETLDYMVRELLMPEGGFASSQDADSEGEEGKFYVWSASEFQEALEGQQAKLVALFYDVTAGGNFEGTNILHVARDLDVVAAMAHVPEERVVGAVTDAKPVLLCARNIRIKPGLDDKVLVSWNGMALRAFAHAAVALDRPDYLQVAVHNASFVTARLLQQGRLFHSYRDGQAAIDGYLEDYANYVDGLIALYEATGDVQWFEYAISLAETILAHFADSQGGGCFDTSDDAAGLIVRPKDTTDNAVPAANSVACDVFLRLAAFTQDQRWEDAAHDWLARMPSTVQQYPSAFGRLLCAYDFAISTPKEIAVIGTRGSADFASLLRVVQTAYLPNHVLATHNPSAGEPPNSVALLAGRPLVGAQATAYVCEHFVCLQPVTDAAGLASQLGSPPQEVWLSV